MEVVVLETEQERADLVADAVVALIRARPTAVLGLAINYSAYEAEVYRAGLQAVPRGQMEAALALGMSRPLALRRVIVHRTAWRCI